MSSPPDTPPLPRAHVLAYLTTTSSPTHVRRLVASGVAWTFFAYLFCLTFFAAAMVEDFAVWPHGFPFEWSFPSWEAASDRFQQVALHSSPYLAFPDLALLLVIPAISLLPNSRIRRILRITGAVLCMALTCTFLGTYLSPTITGALGGSFPSWSEIFEYCSRDNLSGTLFLLLSGLLVTFTAITIPPVYRGRPWACVCAFFALLPALLFTATIAALAAATALYFAIPHPPSTTATPSVLFLLFPAALFTFATLILLDLLRFLLWIARNPHTEKTDTHFLPRRPERPAP